MSVLSQRAPRLLVLGGSGALGAGLVERALELGLAVTCVARSAEPHPLLQERLLAPKQVPYVALDVFAESSQPQLLALLGEHELVVQSCEPWSGEDAQALRGVEGTQRLYRAAHEAGFRTDENTRRREQGELPRRLVRVGSSAAELPLDLLCRAGPPPPWPEQRVTQGALEEVAGSDPCWDNAYFGSKVLQARHAAAAVAGGLDLLTVLPTYVVSGWGTYGGEEPLLRLLRSARATGFLPRTPFNALPADVAATGILLAAFRGEPGERYQLAGVDTDTYAAHLASMRHATGHTRDPLPLPLPRLELLDELRLLRGERRGSAWLDLALLPWDGWRRALLGSYEIEPWHLALLAQGGHRRGDRLRALGEGLPESLAALRLPEEDVLCERLAVAAQRKMEWLEATGLIGS